MNIKPRLLFQAGLLGLFLGWAPFAHSAAPAAELTAAVIIEQNVTFAVVLVKPGALDNRPLADKLILQLEPAFGGIPVVLMEQDAKGTPSYYGRSDISQFLASVPIENMPWKKYVIKQKTAPAGGTR